MDYDTLTFTPESDYRHLDYGFGFYAAQGASNMGDPDKGILMGRIGLPDHHYPTAREFHYTATDNLSLRIWKYRPSVKDDYVI